MSWLGLNMKWSASYGLQEAGNEYSDGHILDRESGNVYRNKMQLIDSGKKLRVRGYIGEPTRGRSQTWERHE
jgi:uncharacterized protein (DUF2147 family)